MTDNKEKLIREAYRRSEERLNCQLTIALAADARALTFSGLLFAGAAILAGLAATSGAIEQIVVAAVLVLAAAVSGWSAMPVGFSVPGGRFKNWKSDIENDVDELEVLVQVGGFNDKHICENDTIMDRNGRWIRVAFFLAVFAPVAGIIVHYHCL